MKIRNKEIIWLLPFFIILSKWILIFYIYRDFSYDFSILLNFNDVSYFPFIVSLSELNLSPTFNEYFVTEKLITFPIASIIFHAHRNFSRRYSTARRNGKNWKVEKYNWRVRLQLLRRSTKWRRIQSRAIPGSVLSGSSGLYVTMWQKYIYDHVAKSN